MAGFPHICSEIGDSVPARDRLGWPRIWKRRWGDRRPSEPVGPVDSGPDDCPPGRRGGTTAAVGVCLFVPDAPKGQPGFERVFPGWVYRNLNASVERRFVLPHERGLSFRTESINALNTPLFAEPVGDLSSPAFGKITNTLNDGRTFRFSLNLEF